MFVVAILAILAALGLASSLYAWREVARMTREARERTQENALLSSRLNQSETRYHRFYDNAPDLFAAFEVESRRLTHANAKFQEVLGLAPATLNRVTYDELFDPHAAITADLLFRAAVRGESVVDRELKLSRVTHGALDVSQSMMAVGSEGMPTHVHVIWRDISDRVAAERELRALNETLEERVEERTQRLNNSRKATLNMLRDLRATMQQLSKAELDARDKALKLERSNEELDQFAYIASHDLRTPLRGIESYCSFLKEDHADELSKQALELVADIVAQARRMDHFIADLHFYSRVGRIDLALDDVSMNDLVDDIIASFAPLIKKEGNIAMTRVGDLPKIFCDRVRVGEIFRNLIENGIKYNSSPQKTIIIGWKSDTETPHFFIEDNGIGIEERHRESVFAIFKRLHAEEAYGGGSGAGLTIVKRIVERHNGRIWIDSSPSGGACFRFSLALAADEKAA